MNDELATLPSCYLDSSRGVMEKAIEQVPKRALFQSDEKLL
jgi:hypothetical protein